MRSGHPLGRLSRAADFRRVYREGTRRATALLVIHILPNNLGAVRLGLAVGRRFGRAASRNLLRRRLREAVRANRSKLAAGADLVVTPRAAAAAARYPALSDAVGEAMAAGERTRGDRR
jgi:ribonuclease P protein component